jgi:membrane fusion protein (multidrug efflux system)
MGCGQWLDSPCFKGGSMQERRELRRERIGAALESPRRQLQKAAVFGLLCAALPTLIGCDKKEAAVAAGPPVVQVADVMQQDVPIYEEWVAQLNGTRNADITPKVQGYEIKQNYRDGYFVRQGELLFEIDPRPFDAAVDQAKAQLAQAAAGLSRAETDVARDTPLASQNAIPRKQLDNDTAALAAAKAQVAAQQAALEQSKLNLAWTQVRAPISGIAGTAISQVGDLVGTSTKMTTVSDVNPIRAYFNISESDFLDIAPEISKVIHAGGQLARADSPPVEFIQANDVTFPATGHIVLVNRQISAGTGTIQLAAEFPNKDAALRPGGFGRVRIRTGFAKNALLIPQRAVIEVQSIYQVVVVGPDNKAQFRAVKVGDRVGPNWIIREGLNPGERVVVEGFMKIRDGIPVKPTPYKTGAAAGN